MLTVTDSQFLLDDQPFRILSGAMHYFRVMPEYWRDRLEKMRQFGLNTVETYVPWNLHEPRPGEFHFEGRLDIARYIQTAAEVGLKVIVRPGPYICSEWDFGGLPAWLLKDPLMQVRCMYPPYLAAVDRFLDRLLPVLRPWQATNGGPLIACQVENEYGSFGNDQVYVQYIADGLRKRGVDVLLFTSDGPTDGMLQGGTLPDVLTTVNFAFDAPAGLAKLRQYRPTGPQMVAEFWAGWFDHWGEAHHVSPDGGPSFEPSVQSLDEILAAGASVNFYMFHGGTNFGFMSGANYYAGTYLADVTSYDYASPLDEAGDPTPRFAAYRAVMEKYLDLSPLPAIPPSPKAAYGPVQMSAAVGLLDSLDVLSQKQRFVTPPAMEMLDQDYGFILYQTRISGPRPEGTLNVRNLHDRAHVFVNGALQAVLQRETGDEYVAFAIPEGGAELAVLVENMGRINFGPELLDRKGILGGVTFSGQYLFHWDVYPLPLANLERLAFGPLPDKAPAPFQPTFYRASFEVDQPADTFLALPGWGKGVAWINGFNLGRYWTRGPQQTLYVPAPLLKTGSNELVLLELDQPANPLTVELSAQSALG